MTTKRTINICVLRKRVYFSFPRVKVSAATYFVEVNVCARSEGWKWYMYTYNDVKSSEIVQTSSSFCCIRMGLQAL